jgi:dihydroorotate dehydrogenase (fumarate)
MKTWTVGGLKLRSPLMIAGGVCKTPSSIIPYLHHDLPIGLRETGSYTPDFSAGNPDAPQEYWIDTLQSGVNSWGMPNIGFMAALAAFDAMGLPDASIAVNIAAFSPEGFAEGYRLFASRPYVAVVVGNLSCPNRHEQKTIPISLDLGSLRLVLAAIQAVKTETPFWPKLAPAFYKEDLQRFQGLGFDVDSVPCVAPGYIGDLADVLLPYRGIAQAVIGTNTGPNFKYKLDGKPVTRPNGGLAGLSGELLAPISRRMTKALVALLGPSIDVIRTGGIMNGDQAAEAIRDDGCAAVQVASLPHFANNGPKAVVSLLESEALQELLSTN